jgi:chitodextrinase
VNDAAVQVECTTITHNLVLGSRDKNTGGDVTELQVYLAQTNYLDADPTGYFGKLTKKAVQAFQSANNISPIGNVGPVTRAKVKELSCGSSSSASAQPVSNTVSGAVVPVATANNGVSNNQQSVAATSSSVVAPAASNSASDTQAPSIPTNLSAFDITTVSFGLTWTTPSDNVGVTGYRIFRNGTFIGSSVSNKIQLSGFQPNTTGTYSVAAVDAAGNVSPQSSGLTVTTSASVVASNVAAPVAPVAATSSVGFRDQALVPQGPSIPQNLSASNLTQTSLTLSWNASFSIGNSGAVVYKVYKNGVQIGSSQTTSYAVTGLSAGNNYSFTVSAQDSAGNTSSQSTAFLVATPEIGLLSNANNDTQAPSVPTNVNSYNVLGSVATIQWQSSTDNVGIKDYRLYQNGKQIAVINGNFYTVLGLTPSTIYSFTVAAEDTSGNLSSQSSPLTITTSANPDTQPPTAPTGLSSSGLSQTGFNFSWAASTDNVGVVGYRVLQGSSDPNAANDIIVGTTTSTSIAISGLTPGTKYNFIVVAFDARGNEARSSIMPITTRITGPVGTADTQAPSIPSNVVSSGITQTSVTISWSPSTDNVGVTGYKLYRGGVLVTTLGNVTTYTDSTLTKGTSYYYEIKALDAAGNMSMASSPLLISTEINPVSVMISPNSVVPGALVTVDWDISTIGSPSKPFLGFVARGYNSDAQNGLPLISMNNILKGSAKQNAPTSPGVYDIVLYSSTYTIWPLTGQTQENAPSELRRFKNVLTVTTNPTIGDTQAPTTPSIALVAAFSKAENNLNMTVVVNRSDDNVGVAGYKIYRNGVLVKTLGTALGVTGYDTGNITGVTTYNFNYLDGPLAPDTLYTYTVEAYDAAGNVSALSSPVSAKSGIPLKLTATPASVAPGGLVTVTWDVRDLSSSYLGPSNLVVFAKAGQQWDPALSYSGVYTQAQLQGSGTIKAPAVAGDYDVVYLTEKIPGSSNGYTYLFRTNTPVKVVASAVQAPVAPAPVVQAPVAPAVTPVVMGSIDNVTQDGIVTGWMCEKGVNQSITFGAYVGNQAVGSGNANLLSTQSVASACSTATLYHGFSFDASAYRGQNLVFWGFTTGASANKYIGYIGIPAAPVPATDFGSVGASLKDERLDQMANAISALAKLIQDLKASQH